MAKAKKADIAKHAVSRRALPIRCRFRLIGLNRLRGLPFDRHEPVRRMNGAKAGGAKAGPADLEGVFVVGRLHRAMPGPVELLQHLLRRAVSGIEDPLQRLEVTGLVTAGVVDAAATAQPRTR